MRQAFDGNGDESTSAVRAYLRAGKQLQLANLYLIGEWEDPNAKFLTDYEAPLAWPIWGTFLPSTIKRGSVTSQIGLDSQTLEITWSPPVTAPVANPTIATASPYQLAQIGYYDNMRVRIWTCYMPSPGDANTLGASELWGGRIGKTTVQQGAIIFEADNWLKILDQQVPNNVIEVSNTMASYTGATPPKGYSQIPQFNVASGNSTTQVIGVQTSPNANGILDTNSVKDGFLAFNYIAPNPLATPPVLGSTLGGIWRAIQQNTKVTVAGIDYNQFVLYDPLPFTPTPGQDTFYVSRSAPIDRTDGDYSGFPFVPSPELAV